MITMYTIGLCTYIGEFADFVRQIDEWKREHSLGGVFAPPSREDVTSNPLAVALLAVDQGTSGKPDEIRRKIKEDRLVDAGAGWLLDDPSSDARRVRLALDGLVSLGLANGYRRGVRDNLYNITDDGVALRKRIHGATV